ncbi:MAG: tRNA (adenosine(37)-N6)-threonylcarbamoyltransferase complex dimerization subunit type 1 TsaB [Deltaproteobacteria bacterium CG_4_8_14_3_um_filter_45_9]|jgi:tRNA threonylcarbamoyladenosine biosynthesis protein TsaB|nr:MAG: tRNA (adenosine(37)-N6)-threonylcarbamoyltransferase complex dimerization subunit type 1 TsaB [Deltaproteobacteria bacterium CG03_land_8_20_14_0_80_45_14]PIX25262.1 MAG: tRNA (adenosine(37)-N6)-threonylcarbamoyltransferase complex dimerization subunit type 1 TsaB [Deltaproteobacteria bacterium CG_4_8_14_3_um_filter_45_9]
MKVLGIDTSTSCGSVGLIDDGEVISDYLLKIPVTHSERLLGAIEFVLKEARCNIEDIDGWAISLGPGSFTGLRIGVSAVKGLTFATGKPVAGVSTLDVLASQIAPTSYLICPILDARKKEVYTAFYRYEEGRFLKRLSDYQAIRPEDLVEKIKEQTIFLGDGVKTYGDLLLNFLPSLAILPPAPLHVSHGSMVAKLGSELLQKGESLNPSTFTPLYVRSSEAEMKWQETHSN